jgi:sarcosine oxidase gamma subunit
LFSEQSDPESLLDRLRPAIDPAQTSLLNNSDGLATFRLSGQGAPWLLSKLSGLDYLAGSSGDVAERQHCARTRMAHAAVVVHYHQPGNEDSPFVFDLLFDRSLAKYLWDLLTESTAHADDLTTTFG